METNLESFATDTGLGSEDESCITDAMISEQERDNIIATCAQNPACAKKPMDGSKSTLALHQACKHADITSEIIHALIEVHPEAVLTHDDNGYLPLHLACQSTASAPVLERLLREHPETAFDKSKPRDNENFGITAARLLWDCTTKSTDDRSFREDYSHVLVWPKMQVLLEGAARHWNTESVANQASIDLVAKGAKKTRKKRRRHQDCEESSDGPGSSLCCLHAAVALHALDAPIELLQYALWKYPEQVDLVDGRHRLPLHIAVASKGPSSAISVLLQVDPETASSMDPNEQLCLSITSRRGRRWKSSNSMKRTDNFTARGSRYPLHSALANGHTWESGVQDLADNCSEAVVCPDGMTALYPYQLAAISGPKSSADLDTIFGLLRAGPGVLMAEDDQETGLGILVLQSDHERSSVTNEALLCLLSDDESMEDDFALPVASQKGQVFAVDEAIKEDSPSGLRSSHHEYSRRSFVSFDDQAHILEQAAAVYQKRRESGFKDLGLMKHIDDCIETRSSLRAVGDPEVLRKKKIADFIEEYKRTKPRGKNTHGLSEFEVKERRASLRHVSESERGLSNKSKDLTPPSSPISKMRSKLRSASSPRRRPDCLPSLKKWTPTSSPTASRSSIGSPLNIMFGSMGKVSKKKISQDSDASPVKREFSPSRASAAAKSEDVCQSSSPPEKRVQSMDVSIIAHSQSAACTDVQQNVEVNCAELQAQEAATELSTVQSNTIQSEIMKAHTVHQDKTEVLANSTISEKIDLPIKLKHVSRSHKESSTEESRIEEVCMSPLQKHKAKLRSVKTRLPTPLPILSNEKAEDEVALSPYQVQREKLRATKTKPRAYTCSILLVPSGKEDTSDSRKDQKKMILENKAVVVTEQSHEPVERADDNRLQLPKGSPGCADSFETIVTIASAPRPKKVIEIEGTETSSNKEIPESSTVETSQCDTLLVDKETQSTEVASVNSINSSDDELIGDTKTNNYDSASGSEHDTYRTDNVAAQQKADTRLYVDSVKTEREPDHAGENILTEDTSIGLTKRRVLSPPKRHISSENILWKRAEMEIRNQVRRAHERLDRYRTQCLNYQERRQNESSRMLGRFNVIQTELIRLKATAPGTAISKEEYSEIIQEKESESDRNPEETQNEVSVLMYMHFMIVLEKQEKLESIHVNAIKTYLLRCKAWLQDYESIQKYMRDLRVQNMALRTTYKGLLQKQQKLIRNHTREINH